MRVLALRGARVIGTARTLAKAEAACRQVSSALVPLACELESQDSIRACAREVSRLGRPLDLCIANAGIMALPERALVNGVEKQLATNHLGHFLLVNLLRPQLEAARAPVVVLANAFSSWMWRPASEHHAFDWAQGYLQREYDVAGVVEILESGTKSVWGDEARSYSPSTDESIIVFRRKPASEVP